MACRVLGLTPWGSLGVHSSTRERGQDYCLAAYGDKVFAVPVACVFKVLAAAEWSLRPDLRAPLLGWAEVGGARIPVADLAPWVKDLASAAGSGEHVVTIDTGAGFLGLAIDRVRGIATILETEIRTPPPELPAVIAGLWPQRTYAVHILDPRQFAVEARRWGDEFNGAFRGSISPAPAPAAAARSRSFCFFERRGRHFALPVLAAREVVVGEGVTPVPQAPQHVLGVINLRGTLLPLINADSFLGLPASEAPASYEALVVESEGVQLGLLVDRVGDVRPIDLLEVHPAPAMDQAMPVYRGVWSSPEADVLLLDVDQLVNNAIGATTRSFQRSVSALSGLEEDSDAVPDATS